MTRSFIDDPMVPLLAERVPTLHLRQRLGLEAARDSAEPIESWKSLAWLIRTGLRLGLVYERARRNVLDIQVSTNEVFIPELPSAFEGFTILHMSDLHLDSRSDFAHVLRARVEELQYDACVLTGDYRFRTKGAIEPSMTAMRHLRDGLQGPVFGVLGNHDSLRMVPMMEAMDIAMLLNESTPITAGTSRIHLAGIDDPHHYQVHDIERAGADIPTDEISILLAHSPEAYLGASGAGFDLMLSGHTHGGQIRLPGGLPVFCNARCPRAYCSGAWKHGEMLGYTTVGAGSSVVDVRLNCRPEVVLHRLTATAGETGAAPTLL